MIWFEPSPALDSQLSALSLLHFFWSQDSSSVITFKCVLRLLESIRVAWFQLENVDLELSPDSNLDCILKSLEQCGPGYMVRAYNVVSTDFGLPTRRQRLYFIGVSKAHYPLFDMNKVTEILSLLKLETQQPVTGRNSIYNKYSIMYSNIILLIYSYSYT